MTDRSPIADWENLRVFAGAAEAGSVSEAAKRLGIAYSTVSRRLAELEAQTGAPLFLRTPQGIALTEDGRRLLAEVRAFEAALGRVARMGAKSNLREGVALNLACTEGLAAYWISRFLSGFAKRNPTLSLRVKTDGMVKGDRAPSFDAQIQLFTPTDPFARLIRLGTVHFMPMASKSYVADFGAPRTAEERLDHNWIDYIPFTIEHGGWSNWLSDERYAHQSTLVTNSVPMVVNAVRSGAGIGVLPTYFAVLHDDLVPLEIGPRFKYPIWFSFPAEQETGWAMRALIAFLKEIFDPAAMPWFAEDFVAPSAIAEQALPQIVARLAAE